MNVYHGFNRSGAVLYPVEPIPLTKEFYQKHPFVVVDPDGNLLGYYATARCGAHTAIHGAPRGTVVRDTRSSAIYNMTDCHNLILRHGVLDMLAPGTEVLNA